MKNVLGNALVSIMLVVAGLSACYSDIKSTIFSSACMIFVTLLYLDKRK